jgi:hypothetical protein
MFEKTSMKKKYEDDNPLIFQIMKIAKQLKLEQHCGVNILSSLSLELENLPEVVFTELI